MYRVLLFIISLLAAWLFGDWRNWRKYYPTILYFILCSLLYSFLYCERPLWHYEPVSPLDSILSNNTRISIAITFIVFPCTALIYLGHYPPGRKQVPYILLWILIYTGVEAIALQQKGMIYFNGWSLGWSILFDVALFSLVRLHYVKPMAAWGASVLFIAFIWSVFGVPI